ncbi:MAG: RNA polymerase factor sigma-54, partial [Deltaproteobacteria bacterium]
MKPALQLRINQQLALTPQLQQAIRLLQLSSVELEMELREALESNPLLELAEAEGGNGETEAQADGEAVVDIAGDGESATAEREEPDYDEPMDFELERSDYGAPMPEDAEGFEAQDGEPEDLRDHLLWQLNLTSMSARDRAIGVTIIEAIDDDGYLHESDETLQSNLAGLYRVGADEIEAVRHRIQQFDPLGVGSRSLSECLCVQLDACDPQTPGWHAAKTIAAEHLEELARNDRTRLCRQLKV